MTSHRRTAVLLLAGLLTLATACSQDPVATTTSAAEPGLTVSMFEWGFGPSMIPAEAGSISVMRLRNDGALLHDWAILFTPIETEADLRSDDIVVSASVEPGAVDVIEFETPPAGTYQIICTISGHFSAGMEGTLVVAP